MTTDRVLAEGPPFRSAHQVATLLHVGRPEEARALLTQASEMALGPDFAELQLLASNAFGGPPPERLARLNAFFACFGLPPAATLRDTAPPGPSNLCAAGVPPVAAGPLVTVLMTTCNSGARAEQAIRSVLAQSWQAIELIVVDDASEDDTPQRLQAIARAHPAVRLVRLARNAGTYVAKSIGLQQARGEFVTCHDSDDWSHPLKIELQVRPLLEQPELVATTSCWVRVTDEGTYHARQLFPLVRLNMSSLLFRREPVLARAGGWDAVRTGADTEFHERLKRVFGADAIKRLPQPLSLGSHRPGSLMTAPESGYAEDGTSPDREAYVAAWTHWHRACVARGAVPWLPPQASLAAAHRPFAAPASIAVAPELAGELERAAGIPGCTASVPHRPHWLAAGPGVGSIPTLPALLEGQVVRGPAAWGDERLAGVLAWGRKPSAAAASRMARRLGLPTVQVEDGFLRSYRTGEHAPPLSIVVDRTGLYYDATAPSSLEDDLNRNPPGPADQAREARELIVRHRLSKYNHAPAAPVLPPARSRVLVVDQTEGDHSVALGSAGKETFQLMLQAARAENPGATVYVKTHPEVSSGRKRGYLTDLRPDAATVMLRDPVDPIGLIEQMDRVYVVSSTMGFEALLAGKPVTCFGIPWYAGWGLTDDRQACPRRQRRHTVDSLFEAAYLRYARYLDPRTHERGTIFDVIEWLVRQRESAAAQRPCIAVGMRRWKAHNLHPMLALEPQRVAFVPDAAGAAALEPGPGHDLLVWGADAPAGVEELAQRRGARLVRIEDGFVRSVGLGSDLIRPHSLVLDPVGLYFDPRTPSRLERILAGERFGADELAEAARVRQFIVDHGITKYNLEPREPARWKPGRRRVVLVPGQVEDDASIRLGCTTVRTNLQLLQAVRAALPDAWIVYKPHPDTAGGNRKGRLSRAQALRWADHVEDRLSVISCIEACDEVHTMTSLSGFDALLRGKRVVTYGQPFYAGWGLTTDTVAGGAALARRQRRLTLDELVAGALLRYPVYWDWTLGGYTTCMAVLRTLARERDALERQGRLADLRTGWWRRQQRKLRLLVEAWTTRP